MLQRKLIIFLALFCSACSNLSDQTKLLYRIELRNISKDEITEYRVFENGLVNKTIIHNTSNQTDLYKSSFIHLSKPESQAASAFLKSLQELDYYNDFPWKEDFYKRGNVIKFEFPDPVELNYLSSKENTTVLVPKVFYYYDGHKDSPKLFAEMIRFLNNNKSRPVSKA